jgi:hypothetical protein
VSDQTPLANRRKSNLGRLDHPSRAADRVSFAASFGKRFILFVDTEEEFDWSKPRSRKAVSTSAIAALPEFQALADAHAIRPCYLIDYPVADNPTSAATLRGLFERGRCDIGTQLHPWVNPPFDEDVTTFNSFVGNLPVETERAKLVALTARIETAVGVRPTVYRAGRYGVGAHTAALLEDAGYRMDVSVRPHFDYSGEGGPNFRRHDPRPYWVGPSGAILEVPLGVTYTGPLRRFSRFLKGEGPSVQTRSAFLARSGLATRIALTPEDMPVDDVRRAVDLMLDDGLELLSFSFHSPSLVPGHTPYVRTSADLSAFYGWWDILLRHLDACAVTPVGVDELWHSALATR